MLKQSSSVLKPRQLEAEDACMLAVARLVNQIVKCMQAIKHMVPRMYQSNFTCTSLTEALTHHHPVLVLFAAEQRVAIKVYSEENSAVAKAYCLVRAPGQLKGDVHPLPRVLLAAISLQRDPGGCSIADDSNQLAAILELILLMNVNLHDSEACQSPLQ